MVNSLVFIYYTFGIEIPDQVGDDENDQVGDDEKGRHAASQYITMFQESARSDRGLLVRGSSPSTFRP